MPKPTPRPTYAALVADALSSVRAAVKQLREMEGRNMKYVPAIAQRLSGLTERSHGTGMNRASVYHARMLEDAKVGRITRAKGDFLCRRWHPWDIADHPGGKVNCPRCVAILARVEGE